MMGFLARHWKLVGSIVLATIGALMLLAGAFMASGTYNVAASEPHWLITEKLITFTLRRAVETRSMFVDVPQHREEDLIPLGANHFSSACAPCHGSPTKSRSPIVLGMLPTPPPLRHAASKWTPAQLFWIVKHGLKYTGMPAWPAERRDDEVWAVVAFLRRLPELGPAEYSRLVGAEEESNRQSSAGFFAEMDSDPVAFCARCHGAAGMPPASRRVPSLHGQSGAYLRRALEEYRDGKRPSGFMEPVAARLAPADMQRVADVFAAREPIRNVATASDPDSLARGRAIAESGIRQSGVPPCLACHAGRASRQFPMLAGLSAEYMAGQLSLWRHGLRNATAYGAIMAVIANRLTEEQIRDVTGYLQSLPRQAADRASTTGASE